MSACKLGLLLNLPLTQCQFLVYLMSSVANIITLNTHYFFDRKLNCVYNLTSKSLNISWLRNNIPTLGFVPENGSVLTISVCSFVSEAFLCNLKEWLYGCTFSVIHTVFVRT